jgi:N6-L-threonylcarbamoyladenine synthase
VVPELASRAHQQNIIPVVEQAISDSGIDKKDIDAVAFTRGPGLMGALLVGTSFAKSFALALNKPLIAVNHMQAHILAHFIKEKSDDENHPEFPFLCLTVSGGHTQIVLVKTPLIMEILGETIDDAAGEAFDKSAKILGLPYPGGPLIDKYAKEGDPKKFTFTKPKTDGLNYSFSGLKTNILYFIQKKTKENPDFISENRNDLCASIQECIVEILMINFEKAILLNKVKHIAISGGVSANSRLRKAIQDLAANHKIIAHIPAFQFCTDNAAMIAMGGFYLYKEGVFSSQDITPLARMDF